MSKYDVNCENSFERKTLIQRLNDMESEYPNLARLPTRIVNKAQLQDVLKSMSGFVLRLRTFIDIMKIFCSKDGVAILGLGAFGDSVLELEHGLLSLFNENIHWSEDYTMISKKFDPVIEIIKHYRDLLNDQEVLPKKNCQSAVLILDKIIVLSKKCQTSIVTTILGKKNRCDWL